MKLKSKIGYVRDKEGRTNKWLASKLNVTQETISRWVNDKGRPSVEKLFELAEILNCKVDDLYEKDK